MKPIVRWTMTRTSSLGQKVFGESIRSFVKVYGDKFDLVVLLNNVEKIDVDFCGAKVVLQNPKDFLLGTPSTSYWKWCPPRFAIDRHEIAIDNDVIIHSSIPMIDEFLFGDKPMILEDAPVDGYGRYGHWFDGEQYSAAFIGMPPYFDMGKLLFNRWQKEDVPTPYDEQGHAASCIKEFPHLVVPITDLPTIPKEWCGRVDWKGEYCRKHLTATTRGYHFCGSNRNETHLGYNFYKKRRFLML